MGAQESICCLSVHETATFQLAAHRQPFLCFRAFFPDVETLFPSQTLLVTGFLGAEALRVRACACVCTRTCVGSWSEKGHGRPSGREKFQLCFLEESWVFPLTCLPGFRGILFALLRGDLGTGPEAA